MVVSRMLVFVLFGMNYCLCGRAPTCLARGFCRNVRIPFLHILVLAFEIFFHLPHLALLEATLGSAFAPTPTRLL